MSINLKDFNSKCEKRAKQIVSKEKHCEHRVINEKAYLVRQYLVDGDIFPKGKKPAKCDYLLLNDSKEDAYFIELKGSDTPRALEQIIETEKLLKHNFIKYTTYYRIIFFSGTMSVRSSKIINFQSKHKGKLKIERSKITDIFK